jgi:syntaxin 5
LESVVKTQKDDRSTQIKSHSESLVNTLQSNLVNTTKVFTDALEIRTKNLKVQEERREKITGTRRTTPSPIIQPDFDMFDNSDDGDMDQEISISVPLMETNDLIIDRKNAVDQIHEEINKIREMFQKLAQIVAIQNDSLMRIGDNIDDVYVNVTTAQNNLLTYLQRVVSDRSMIIKIFLILAFFIFLFFMFFV